MIFRPFRTFLAICALAQFQVCIAILSNRTVDDFNGDLITGFLPLYEPQNAWNTDGNCTSCSVKPDPTQALDHTWHDSSQRAGDSPSSVTLQFTGTAIYLFCIVPADDATNLVNLTFTLDGTFTGAYTHTPIGSKDISYLVPVLATGGFNNTPHTLVARTASPSLFIFDYAMYT
ncbi:hypothetical protein B0H17DRAFT_1257583 [Mycena rosella]|uniref:Uncharacterized protein n=1 Tax=Mycena rosella TaxID=1033263 RepID=A0AAD7G6Z6_MYCRO|nr:hypothetical protein B0H17DRAFT_1257583 [Mycena rosella]